MKEIEIIEIDLSSADNLSKVRVEMGDERYFIAYETDHTNKVSVQFKDWSFLRKHFGVDRNVSSPITHESLNESRIETIENYKIALKHNIPLWELGKIDENNEIKINPDTEKPYRLYKLSKQGRVQFQEHIDLGLYVICKYV